jgi:hypothetical protein
MITDLRVLDEVKLCPHCRKQLSCCEAPPFHIGDGLGWGSDVLFICLNDSCSLFLNGWDRIEKSYGHHASYRYMELPGSKEGNCLMVGNADAFKGCVIDRQELEKQNTRYQQEKAAVKALSTCIAEKNLDPVMTLLLDEGANINSRERAADCLVPINDLRCLDALRNHNFRNEQLAHRVNSAIAELLRLNFKKECPHCMELVKAQAKKCLHCKSDL